MMNKPIKKITFILLLIIFLPISFLVFREINSISEYEKNLTRIYKAQLETILFSVNQHTEDVLNVWSYIFYERGEDEIRNKSDVDIYSNNKSVVFSGILDSSFAKLKTIYNSHTDINGDNILSVLSENRATIKKLLVFKKNVYRKFEAINFNGFGDFKLIVFVLDNFDFAVLAISRNNFVEEKLLPKLSSIHNENISITIFNNKTNKEIFSNSNDHNARYQFSKRLWIFPELSLGIRLVGKDISQVVNEKMYSNILMLCAVIIIVVFLAYKIYRNINNEMQLIKMKSDFVANISHELRTPLSLISLYAETLLLGRIKNEEKRDEYYKIIFQEAERLSMLVNKILGFSKLEEDKMTYEFMSHDLNEIVAKIYEAYKYNFENKGFAHRLESFSEKLMCKVDLQSVNEAIINLIDNAMKYSADRKEIYIRTGKSNYYGFIEVEDMGIGISKSEKEKVFEKFYRVKNGDIYNIKGTGIGLTIVEQVIKAHRGKIDVESQLGVGSKFRLSFPLINSGENK